MRLKVANEEELLRTALKTGGRVRLDNGKLINAEGDVVTGVKRPAPAPAPVKEAPAPKESKPDILVQSLISQVSELTRMVNALTAEIAALRERQQQAPEVEDPEVEAEPREIVIPAPQVTLNSAKRWEVQYHENGRIKAFVAKDAPEEHPVHRLLRERSA